MTLHQLREEALQQSSSNTHNKLMIYLVENDFEAFEKAQAATTHNNQVFDVNHSNLIRRKGILSTFEVKSSAIKIDYQTSIIFIMR